jgi:adenosine deaminase
MFRAALVLVALTACRGGDDQPAGPDGGVTPDAPAAPTCTDGTPAECGAAWEQHASDQFDAVVGNPGALGTFLTAMPKGGDLHQHLTGAVYAETYLDWAKTDGDCINSTTYASVYANQCSASTMPTPTMGAFYDAIVRAWSMKDFVATSTNTGHDHFFATFGKYGAVAGAHRDDAVADVLARAASENQLYIETMFNLGKNLGTLAASTWTQPVTAATLQQFYDQLKASPTFTSQLNADVAVVADAAASYRAILGCDDLQAPPACDVKVRFIAQISRTGALDTVFGQLVSAFEMAAKNPNIVGANLSSPEDDTTSLNNYDLHMQMIAFLRTKYTATGTSPLHITLHAGEVVPQYLPAGSIHNTFHVKAAVEIARTERVGHGVDIATETDSVALMTKMATDGVAVEICLSSNDQILEVKGAAHPLALYMAAGVPVVLATDDQGVSRSSLAKEYAVAATDQHLKYRQLKTITRDSLEHSFLPGASLWTNVAQAKPVGACVATETMGVGDVPNAGCQQFLDTSERATLQWELERRFRVFESAQP